MQLLIVLLRCKVSDDLITETYSVVEIAKPDDSVMIINRSVFLEPKTSADSLIVLISLFIVRESSCKVSSHEAYSSL